jgi:hypothetical protein
MLLWFHNPDRYIPVTSPAQNFVDMYWSAVGPNEILVDDTGYDGASSPGPGAGRLYCLAGSPVVESYVIQRFTPADAQFRVGARFKVLELPAAPFVLMGILDDDGITFQASVVLNPDGTLSFYSGDIGTVLRTSTATITAGAWFRLGLKGRISSTNGEGEVHVDSTRSAENVVTRVTLVDTNPTASGRWGGLYLGVSGIVSVAHMYACDGTGVRNNGLLHGAFVRSYPASYTPTPTYADWSPSDAGAAIDSMIEDQEPDLATTYINSITLDDRYSTLVGNGSPAAVDAAVTTYGAQLTQVATNNLGDFSLIPLVVVEGGTYYAPFTSPPRMDASPSEWRAMRGLWADNPKTGKRWTTAKLEAAEWGAQISA